jgi:hypothetical protein
MTKQIEAVRRAEAAQACIDRFLHAPLDYKAADCVRLVRLALVKQGVSVKPLKGLRWASATGALRALKASGFKSLIDGMDATGLPRIAPARALAGDVLALPVDASNPYGAALFVSVGNGRHLGFVDTGAGLACEVCEVVKFETAWRVA